MANKKITDLMSGTPTRDSYLESATDVGGTMVSRKFKVGAVADVNNIQIASEYDDTATYVYGAYCIKDGVLYRCTTAISVAEAWTVAHWTAVMVTGEYKRVRIMTKAQFDLLSNDEKDGFIYVSDYPTKIQDIDNVTLTTSDNNKLLGVSVSGSDISVGAVNAPSEIPVATDTLIFNDVSDNNKPKSASLGDVLAINNINSNERVYDSHFADITFCNVNGMKSVYIKDPTGLTASGMTNLGTIIPATYRPTFNFNTDLRIANSNSTIRIYLNSNGSMSIYNYTSTTTTLNIEDTVFYF